MATASGQGNTVAEQTQATLAQLETNLLEAGSGKNRIVEAVVYLNDMNKKAEMDAVWCDWIPADGWPNRARVLGMGEALLARQWRRFWACWWLSW